MYGSMTMAQDSIPLDHTPSVTWQQASEEAENVFKFDGYASWHGVLSSLKPNKQRPHSLLNLFLPKQRLHVRVSPEKENTHGGRYKDIDDSSMVLV